MELEASTECTDGKNAVISCYNFIAFNDLHYSVYANVPK